MTSISESSTAREAQLAAIRDELPALGDWTYLNTGTAGPLPRRVAAVMRGGVDSQLTGPRSDLDYLRYGLAQTRQTARVAFASLLGCAPSEIALTTGVSSGMNVATLGVDWGGGDEAVTTDVEHPGALFPLYCVRDRFGVAIRVADVSDKDSAGALDAITSLVTPKTKLISLSHVSYSTGQVLPISEVCRFARDRGVRVLVDGAQSFGCVPLDMAELGCDWYAVPGQKWLCGPEGSGALYVATAATAETGLLFPGFHSAESWDDRGVFVPRGDAEKLEHGTINPAALLGATASADWLRDAVGMDFVWSRSFQLAEKMIARLRSMKQMTVLTPLRDHAGIVSAVPAGVPAEELVARMREARIQIRSLPKQGAIRLSLGFFNTEQEVDKTCDLLESFLHSLDTRSTSNGE